MPTTPRSILALDVGSKRIGVAVASLIARLPHPLTTLSTADNIPYELAAIIKREDIERLVVGLPRGLDGQETAQTKAVLDFTQDLKTQLNLPIDMQDEALTSKKAEAELEQRGKPYQPGDVDALAATYILEDWFAGQKEHV
jgi:putative Holliday junction resolvase